MFRAKTTKRNTSKKNSISGPITPISHSQDVSGVTLPTVPLAVIAPSPVSASDRNSNAVSTESMLSVLLDAESKAAVHRPWLRLERGLRMRLLRAYVEKQSELSQQERVDLLLALVDALDRKLLNSKSQITYNVDTGDILEINALKIIKPTAGKTIFRIEPPHRSTKKAKRPSGSDSE
jgi:hypothetical protein